MKLLTKEQQKSYENAKIYYICKENFENRYMKDKIYRKEIIAIMQGNIEVLRIAYVIENIMYLKKFLQFFIMDLTMIGILS